MRELTAEKIAQMFRDLDLEVEEQRQAFVRLGSQPADKDPREPQLFIRIVSSTSSEEGPDNAKLAQHP